MTTLNAGEGKVPSGFIRLTINTNNEPVIVRLASIEMVRSSMGSTYVQTSGGGGIYVIETVDEIAASLTPKDPEQ